jgi:hypothetical protein
VELRRSAKEPKQVGAIEMPITGNDLVELVGAAGRPDGGVAGPPPLSDNVALSDSDGLAMSDVGDVVH